MHSAEPLRWTDVTSRTVAKAAPESDGVLWCLELSWEAKRRSSSSAGEGHWHLRPLFPQSPHTGAFSSHFLRRCLPDVQRQESAKISTGDDGGGLTDK